MTRIAIDLGRRIGPVDRRIFSNFIEHIGRCIYGGIYDEGSPLSDAHGFRRDVLDAARPLRVPVLRWPGGNFVSGYHWTDGVGPVHERPRRSELAWYAEESNRFGTDEFLRYCRVLGTEPYICVNMGSGTMDEAQAWVEYCNGTGNTHWANLRRRHGHAEPYRVRYWALGDEMYGTWQIGHLSPEDYVKKARAFALVMKRTDPSIELIGCGHNGWSEWDQVVIDGLAPLIDFYSIHLYTGQADHYATVFQSHQAERAVHICAALIERARYAQRVIHPIHIAFDEWNVWYRTRSHEDKEGLFLQTIYHPLRLYAEHTREVALDVHVDGPIHDLPPAVEEQGGGRVHHVADLGPFQLLDAVASCDAGGRDLTVAVVNRDRERSHRATVDLGDAAARGEVQVSEVNGPDVGATNSFAHPRMVDVREKKLPATDRRIEYEFPAHSVTLLRMEVAG